MKSKKAFCVNCANETEFETVSSRRETTLRGISFSYLRRTAVCSVCGNEVYVPSVNDENVRSIEEAYRTAAHIITVEQLDDFLRKYDIGAAPLAKLLGWGDVTVNRYVGGQIPSKANSDFLLRLFSSTDEFEKILENGKDRITSVAYKKCRSAINGLNSVKKNKIDAVTCYLLAADFDITPLALQKLLYYTQGFYLAFFSERIFDDKCRAWVYGPVYPEVYGRYRDFGYDPIKGLNLRTDAAAALSDREKTVADAVLASFGKYSGCMLMRITHKETPWLSARGNLAPTDKCSNVISDETIRDYFCEVLRKFNIATPAEIFKYADAMAK